MEVNAVSTPLSCVLLIPLLAVPAGWVAGREQAAAAAAALTTVHPTRPLGAALKKQLVNRVQLKISWNLRNVSKPSFNHLKNTCKFGLCYKFLALLSKQLQINETTRPQPLPADVCLNFSLFFFLHFHGLKILPRVANLLLLLIGGVWVPGTRESERIAASLSTSSAVVSAWKEKKIKQRGKSEITALINHQRTPQMINSFHG